MARFHSGRAALLGAALLTAAASPPHFPPLALTEPLVLPSIIAPQAAVAHPGFAPAPVPDVDFEGGSLHKQEPAKVELTPNIFHDHQGYLGDGYTPNSGIPREQSKRLLSAPGLNLSVPLQ